MASLMTSPSKRAFSDFSFLEDGIPMNANDVPYQPPPTTLQNLRRVPLPHNVATAQPSVVNRWGFALSRALGAVNFIRPAVLCLSNAAATTALYLLQALPESAKAYLHAPVNIIAVPTPVGNKRRSVAIPSPRPAPRIVSPVRASPLTQRTAVPAVELPIQSTTIFDSQPRVSSVPQSILRRPRTRSSSKTVNFDLSMNQLLILSPRKPSSPDLEDDLDQATRDIDELSASAPAKDRSPLQTDSLLSTYTRPTTSNSQLSKVCPVDEPPSIIPPREVDEPESIVARHTSQLPYRGFDRNAAVHRSQTKLATPVEEERWLAECRAQRRDNERHWMVKYLEVKKERDAERAKVAELKMHLSHAGLNVEEIVLLSSPKTLPDQPKGTGPTEQTIRTLSKTHGDVNAKPFVASNTDVTAQTPTPYTRSRRSSSLKDLARVLSDPSRTATRVPKVDDEENDDPWLSLVKDEELGDRAATELAELSITVLKPKLIEPLSQEWITRINDALRILPIQKKLLSDRSDVTPAALSTLVGKNWLNDAVINEFVGHIVARQQRADVISATGAETGSNATLVQQQAQQRPGQPAVPSHIVRQQRTDAISATGASRGPSATLHQQQQEQQPGQPSFVARQQKLDAVSATGAGSGTNATLHRQQQEQQPGQLSVPSFVARQQQIDAVSATGAGSGTNATLHREQQQQKQQPEQPSVPSFDTRQQSTNAANATGVASATNTPLQQQQQHQKQQPGQPPVPSFVALNSNWWNTIHNKSYSVDEGLRKVVRWARRAKIDGAKLLSVTNLYIPINASAHWTLLAISGVDKTIEYLNSLEGCGPPDPKVFAIARRYLELHLGKDYDPGGWTEVSGRSSAQIGGFDCGAFVCFNALALARGMVPEAAFGPEDMGIVRQRISATLLNDGFQGELDW